MGENLRQRVLSTTNLLLDAVDRLEGGGENRTQVPSQPSSQPSCSTSTPCPASAPSKSRLSSISSVPDEKNKNIDAELSHFFHWNSSLGKRTKKFSTQCKSKKKKMKTWTHTYVCLGSTSHKYIPDTSERTVLKLAGLGEKKFAVFAYATAVELQDELVREYPKLANGGGYELLRAPESGSRELVVIEMPHDGYSVEYLQAVVKAAKIYIRPLQRDLDVTPIVKEVG